MDTTMTDQRRHIFDARSITDAVRVAREAGDPEYAQALMDLADHAGEVARLSGIEGGYRLALAGLDD